MISFPVQYIDQDCVQLEPQNCLVIYIHTYIHECMYVHICIYILRKTRSMCIYAHTNMEHIDNTNIQ